MNKQQKKYKPVPRNSFERRLFERFEEHARAEEEKKRITKARSEWVKIGSLSMRTDELYEIKPGSE